MSFKRKVLKVKAKIKRHQIRRETRKNIKLKAQQRRDLVEAKRLTESFKVREEAAAAKAARNKANAPNVAARKQKIAKLEKQAKSALSGLKKAFVAMDKYANRKR